MTLLEAALVTAVLAVLAAAVTAPWKGLKEKQEVENAARAFSAVRAAVVEYVVRFGTAPTSVAQLPLPRNWDGTLPWGERVSVSPSARGALVSARVPSHAGQPSSLPPCTPLSGGRWETVVFPAGGEHLLYEKRLLWGQ